MKFTATHLVILGSIILLGFFGLAGYDMHMKNQPVLLPEDVVEEAVAEIFENDSVISKPIKVSYEYQPADFISNGDTTYWFFRADLKNKDNLKIQNSRVIKLPYSYFCFKSAADYVADSTTRSIFVQYFKQISEASYYSYKAYAAKY